MSNIIAFTKMNLLLRWLYILFFFILSFSLHDSGSLLINYSWFYICVNFNKSVEKQCFFQGGEDLKSNNKKWSPFYFWLHSQIVVL